ncbi:RNA-binding motif protein, X-linked-like-3 [Drosophila grimshawi]|uniref:RNA-binding motif protein, X-linked-like-3 n=1 Tax=Drosophila grimshawi TaxID=7222 RepID=UPI0013EF2069|nr:RNA-binding motif protein, X-linked-like-3 [Drosophila grimshawi]
MITQLSQLLTLNSLQLLCLAVVCCVQAALRAPEPRSATPTASDKQAPAGVLDSVLRGNGKSRQSRCVRCYEDRYYGSSGSDRYGGYSSRGSEEPRSSWYYSYDRYDDRGRDRDYDRSYSRDDRYKPRTYDRYEGRGYDDYYRRGSSSYDRSPGYSSYSGYSGYSGYDSRDRYSGDRYGDSSRDRYSDRYGGDRYGDRYSDRSRSGYDKYDPYDRYYSRYDYRNYRPWDETYRGQSGFDNSGRGYYFAGDDDDRRSNAQPFHDRDRTPASPCGHMISNCPYDSRGGTKVSSSAIGSDGYRGGHTSVMGDMAKPNGQGSWTYLGDQDKQSSRGSSGGGSSNGSGSASAAGGGGGGGSSSANGGGSGGGGGRDRERDAQSSSYGGRPRPLGGSYLFDRDSNAVPQSSSDAANSNGNGGDGGNGSASMPAAAAQTAAKPNESQDIDGQDKTKAMQ